ncbi:TerB family tellurite resistance protein [Vibrio breoganii]|uniref:TerB family tellurite resistance protein n=1 Tax=Vibrio breoganii TaxID=553239 RepID=UPI0010BD60AF|nr:TerB family tellurite resistance protein [Vibrio breoganii]TKG15356.1 TerB family tellurite resistance protein [Vibrio breoganii]
MEGILAIVGICIAFAVVRMVISALFTTAGAAGKALVGKGDFKGNMELGFKGMQSFDVQVIDSTFESDGVSLPIKQIQCKGLFPVTKPVNASMVISIFDASGEELVPVLAAIENFQEQDSPAYQTISEVGVIKDNQGFTHWVNIGGVFPEILEPPYSGNREIKIIVRLVDSNNPPSIHHGFHHGNDGILWQKTLPISMYFKDKGYIEVAEDRDESKALSIKIAMGVAMSDGSLGKEEAEIFRNWIVKSIEPFAGSRKNELKDILNSALKDSFSSSQSGTFHLNSYLARMNKIADKSVKYETIELCFDIMAADGVADAKELDAIKNIATYLGLNMEEISKMRDQRIVNLNSEAESASSLEDLLGIESDWSTKDIKKHLRQEFQKWNNRLNALDEGEQRDNAQLMLDRISEARKKYQ